MTSTSSARLTCLCGAISESGSLLAATEFPILKETCHCNSCRYSTGLLNATFPPLKTSPSESTLSKLTPYHSSSGLTRYFCSVCGSKCFAHNKRSQRWSCLMGIIEQDPSSKAANDPWPKDIVKVWYHDFVSDTVDGGLVPLQLNISGRSIPTWAAEGPEPPPEDGSFDLPHDAVLSFPSKSKSALPKIKEGSFLPAKCHCGGVSLLIKRASYISTSSPGQEHRYLPSDPTKYLSRFCSCRSCRVGFGGPLVPWIFTPPGNIFIAPTTIDKLTTISSEDVLHPLAYGASVSELNANPGLTVKHYWSSPDACWSFCGNCGASVYYWNRQRPDEIDIAAGLLRSDDGSLARSWLDWDWGRCGFAEECSDSAMLHAWYQSPEIMKRIGG